MDVIERRAAGGCASAPSESESSLVVRRRGADHRARWRPGQSLATLFAARCASERVAADGHLAWDGDDAQLSYAMLDKATNRLTRSLEAGGVGPGASVALLFERSSCSARRNRPSGSPGWASRSASCPARSTSSARTLSTAILPRCVRRRPSGTCRVLLRGPTTSPTSSTPPARAVDPRAWPSRTARSATSCRSPSRSTATAATTVSTRDSRSPSTSPSRNCGYRCSSVRRWFRAAARTHWSARSSRAFSTSVRSRHCAAYRRCSPRWRRRCRPTPASCSIRTHRARCHRAWQGSSRSAAHKIDRRALAVPARTRGAAAAADPAREHVAPRDAEEKALADALGAVLGVEEVSIDDDVFDDLGADSMSMAAFAARVRMLDDVLAPSMREIYEHRTVRQLRARARAWASTDSGAAPRLDGAQRTPSALAWYGTGLAQCVLATAWFWLNAHVLLGVLDAVARAPTAAALALHALGGALALSVPRPLHRALEPGRVYPLHGFHFALPRAIGRMTNLRAFNDLFGDSSLALHYLRGLGYRFERPLVQTGSNFGMEQSHDDPYLCEFGSATLVSDDLVMLNADFSNRNFRLDRVRVGAGSFLGNRLFWPAGARVGDDCLLGTKTMVPLDGPPRSGIGLLGSPCFEIPRSVARDRDAAHYDDPRERRARLRAKDRSNGLTMVASLLVHWSALALVASVVVATVFVAGRLDATVVTVAALLGGTAVVAFDLLIEHTVLGFRPLRPRSCSVLDDYYWRHERYWKLSTNRLLSLFDGTPMKPWLYRRAGVRTGRHIYDGGCGIPDKSLVTIGDGCTLDEGSLLQAHSLEDGQFKSGRIRLGRGCSVGPQAFIHYGTVLGDGCRIDADAFLMKGESVPPRSIWRGNPAQERVTCGGGGA